MTINRTEDDVWRELQKISDQLSEINARPQRFADVRSAIDRNRAVGAANALLWLLGRRDSALDAPIEETHDGSSKD